MKKYQFNFSDFKILRVDFSVNKEFTPPDKNETVEISSRIDTGHEEDGNRLTVSLGVYLDSDHVPFDISIECVGVFTFSESLDQYKSEFIEEVANVNCAAIIFPYLRETVADLTRRAGFPPLHMPPVNFVEIFKRSKKTEIKNSNKN
ncbi:MAG: protein-export chaperone SecB [Desulfuromonadales bacterium]|nr:protein-export chaperone SecB [Desulfuromonadales bacterium]